jgi:hypothetical protein
MTRTDRFDSFVGEGVTGGVRGVTDSEKRFFVGVLLASPDEEDVFLNRFFIVTGMNTVQLLTNLDHSEISAALAINLSSPLRRKQRNFS